MNHSSLPWPVLAKPLNVLVLFLCIAFVPLSSSYAQSSTAAKLVPVYFLLLDDDQCVSSVVDGESIFATLDADCDSEGRSGSYAAYYTFAHPGGPLHIDLISDFPNSYDAYLILREGSGRDGALVTSGGGNASGLSDDDHEDLRSSQIRKTNLTAGTYTIEASNFPAGGTGSYNLSVYATKVDAKATGKLNDTGIKFSGNETSGNNNSTGISVDQCIASTEGGNNQFERQDCSFGRDADDFVGDGFFPDIYGTTDINDGDGADGFSFLKVSAAGLPMEASDTSPHACVKDNVTGLMWEVKTDVTGLHNKTNTYTWYNTNPSENGGVVGTVNGGSCSNSTCDTQDFVLAVNSTTLCGHNDWRMPTRSELQSLVNYQTIDFITPTIDMAFFPNATILFFWSGSPNAVLTYNAAWGVSFGNGVVISDSRDNERSVRLVRGGQ